MRGFYLEAKLQCEYYTDTLRIACLLVGAFVALVAFLIAVARYNSKHKE